MVQFKLPFKRQKEPQQISYFGPFKILTYWFSAIWILMLASMVMFLFGRVMDTIVIIFIGFAMWIAAFTEWRGRKARGAMAKANFSDLLLGLSGTQILNEPASILEGCEPTLLAKPSDEYLQTANGEKLAVENKWLYLVPFHTPLMILYYGVEREFDFALVRCPASKDETFVQEQDQEIIYENWPVSAKATKSGWVLTGLVEWGEKGLVPVFDVLFSYYQVAQYQKGCKLTEPTGEDVGQSINNALMTELMATKRKLADVESAYSAELGRAVTVEEMEAAAITKFVQETEILSGTEKRKWPIKITWKRFVVLAIMALVAGGLVWLFIG